MGSRSDQSTKHGATLGSRPVLIIFGAAVKAGGRPSGALHDRTLAAVAFGRTLSMPMYLATGGLGDHAPTEAAAMGRLLRECGIEADDILLEETATDTLSSVVACAALLPGIDHGRVYAVTSAYHLPRCILLLRLAGIKARPAPPPRVPASSTLRTRWWWRLREIPAIPYDVALVLAYRFRGKI